MESHNFCPIGVRFHSNSLPIDKSADDMFHRIGGEAAHRSMDVLSILCNKREYGCLVESFR